MLKEEKVIKILCIIEIICSVIVVLVAKGDLEYYFCGLIPMCFVICFMLNYKPVVGLMAFIIYAVGSLSLFLPRVSVPKVLVLLALGCSIAGLLISVKKWQREKREDPENKIFRLEPPEQGSSRTEKQESRLRAFGWLSVTENGRKRSYAEWKTFLLSRTYQDMRLEKEFQNQMSETLRKIQIDMGVEKILIAEVETLRSIRPLENGDKRYDLLEESIRQAGENRREFLQKNRKDSKLIKGLIVASAILAIAYTVYLVWDVFNY